MQPKLWHTFLSPAKLNLGLKIVGKTSDDYHLLKTVFCLIDLFDTIQIQVTDNGKISIIEHQQTWSYHKDLTYLAARKLKQVSQTNLGANIKIKKVIPSGSGLGGGSSNAATVLIALNELWQTKLNKEELINLGSSLGSDIPFFIFGESAYAEGIGEKLKKIDIPIQHFVIVSPNFHLSTKNVFANVEPNLIISNQSIQIDHNYLTNTLDNDLKLAAIKAEPALENIFIDLQEFGEPKLTGSGSAVFLKFDNRDLAKKVAQSLGTRYNTYLVKSMHKSPIFM